MDEYDSYPQEESNQPSPDALLERYLLALNRLGLNPRSELTDLDFRFAIENDHGDLCFLHALQARYRKLTMMQKMMADNEVFHFGEVYPFWYLGLFCNRRFKELRSQVVSLLTEARE